MSESAYKKFHLAALRAHITREGSDCLFNNQTFKAEKVRLKPDDTRLLKFPGSIHILIAITDDLPSPSPKRGDDLTINDTHYRVTALPDALLPGSTELLLAPA